MINFARKYDLPYIPINTIIIDNEGNRIKKVAPTPKMIVIVGLFHKNITYNIWNSLTSGEIFLVNSFTL